MDERATLAREEINR